MFDINLRTTAAQSNHSPPPIAPLSLIYLNCQLRN
jgi:hypothetical protein